MKKDLKVGILTILPVVVFVSIIQWIFNLISGISYKLIVILPVDTITSDNNEIIWYWKITSILMLITIMWLIGVVINHYYIGNKISKYTKKIISKIPILNILFRISKQINNMSANKTLYEEVVVVEHPSPGLYSIGFITSDKTEKLEELIGSKVYSVFIPTSPNPTNGFLCIATDQKVKKTKISVQPAFEYIISMGTLITLEDVKELEQKK